MLPESLSRVEVVSGALESVLRCRPLTSFDPGAMGFLAALSNSIMKDPDARRMPDLVSFGYWCRRANLEKMRARYDFASTIVGRGVVLHFPPANVPLNFAYSLVCGLLSGNSNIVRLSSSDSIEVSRLVALMDHVLAMPAHVDTRERICLVRYGHVDEITEALSVNSDARVIWGGDKTVSHIKSIPASPRTVDVAFTDRVSLAVLKAGYVEAMAMSELESAAERFYVDGYTFGQNACSSPRLVVWHGDDRTINRAQERFWTAIDAVSTRRGEVEPIHVINRFVELCEKLSSSDSICEVKGLQSSAARLTLNAGAQWQELSSLRFGTFSQTSIGELREIGFLVDSRVQTLGYLGYSGAELNSLVLSVLDRGVDRVVPVGTALEFDLVWDGYDLIRTLSRVVTITSRA